MVRAQRALHTLKDLDFTQSEMRAEERHQVEDWHNLAYVFKGWLCCK